jgi:hypothetical protein
MAGIDDFIQRLPGNRGTKVLIASVGLLGLLGYPIFGSFKKGRQGEDLVLYSYGRYVLSIKPLYSYICKYKVCRLGTSTYLSVTGVQYYSRSTGVVYEY